MKVDKIGQQQNFVQQKKVQQKSTPVSFKAGNSQISDMITNSLKAKNVLKIFKKCEWLKGESGSILLTAIGTGAVAPFFIAYNPFVKAKEGASEEEKREVQNTKTYTAWRQPLSAVLAIFIQLGLLTPIDKGMDQLVNNKEYAKNFRIDIDHSILNTESFIKTNVEKALKTEGIKKPSFLSVFKDGWKKYRENSEAYDSIVKQRVGVAKEGQLSKIANNLFETSTINVGSRTLEHSSVANLINSQINEYVEDAKFLKICDEKINFYSKRADVLIKNEDYIREIFKNVPEDSKELKSFLENLLAKEKNADIKVIIEEILAKESDLQANHIKRTLSRIDTIKQNCNGSYTIETYKKVLTDRNSILDDIIKKLNEQKIAKPESATKETITKALNGIAETCSFNEQKSALNNILHDTDTFGPNVQKQLKKLCKDLSKKYKKFIENGYKSFSQPLKVLIGVCITLPITCNLLNWVYPRFMDLVFPNLSGKKKEGGK